MNEIEPNLDFVKCQGWWNYVMFVLSFIHLSYIYCNPALRLPYINKPTVLIFLIL